MPRTSSDAMPWVGGGKFHKVASASRRPSGRTARARMIRDRRASRRPGAFQVSRDLAPDIAAIEIARAAPRDDQRSPRGSTRARRPLGVLSASV